MLSSSEGEKQFSKESFRMHATVSGDGSRRILTFHGFGQDGSVFNVFDRLLDHTHQLHSFDLPFHGKTGMPVHQKGISRENVKDFFRDYFSANSISSFTLIGFSIGAKFALNLVYFFPEMIERLILIAPDGLKINFWYNIATNNRLSRRIFLYCMEHPGLFLNFADMLTATRVIHPSVSRFVKSQMEDDLNRKLIYDSWVSFRTLNLNIHELGRIIGQHRIPVEIFLGEKDRVIDAGAIRPLVREFPNTRLHMLPGGHTRLIEDTVTFYEREGF